MEGGKPRSAIEEDHVETRDPKEEDFTEDCTPAEGAHVYGLGLCLGTRSGPREGERQGQGGVYPQRGTHACDRGNMDLFASSSLWMILRCHIEDDTHG